MRGRVRRFLGGSENIFRERMEVPNEEVFSSALDHGAIGFVGCSSPLGAALHSEIAGSFCFSAAPLHEVGSW